MPNTCFPAGATCLPLSISPNFGRQSTNSVRAAMDRQCLELLRRVFAGPALADGEWMRLEAHISIIKRRQTRNGLAVRS